MTSSSRLGTRSLGLGYGEHHVLDDLDLHIQDGSFTVIIGPNACGKSTLLKGLARVLEPTSGSVVLDGASIHDLPTKEVARRVGLLPQSATAPEAITVRDLVGRGRYPHQKLFRQWSRADTEAVDTALARARVLELADRPVEALSGGQRQRVWLALVLAQQTDLLLLDEPTTFLDLAHQIEVLDLCSDLLADGHTVIAVLHDLNQACRYATHVVCMSRGRIVREGSPQEVITAELVEEVWGVPAQIVDDPQTGTPMVIPLARSARMGQVPALVSLRLAPYLRIFRAGIRQQSTYRLAALGGLVANTTFGFLKVAMLFATVRAAGGEVGGYDLGAMSAYIWLSQGLLGAINLNGRIDLAERVKTGDVAIDFLRPLSVQASTYAQETGKAVWTLVPRGIPSVLIGALVVGMTMPTTPGPYLLGAVSFLLGVLVSVAAVYLVAVSGFWLVETRGIQVLYMVVSGFLAGLFVPIGLFPTWLQIIANATPFPSMMMAPIDILSGRVAGLEALGTVGIQAAWLAGLSVIGALATRAGRQKLEVQGG
ncbi:ATP-binding cassette domain-containing protein [Dermacoccaceae bacterium W4C1]